MSTLIELLSFKFFEKKNHKFVRWFYEVDGLEESFKNCLYGLIALCNNDLECQSFMVVGTQRGKKGFYVRSDHIAGDVNSHSYQSSDFFTSHNEVYIYQQFQIYECTAYNHF